MAPLIHSVRKNSPSGKGLTKQQTDPRTSQQTNLVKGQKKKLQKFGHMSKVALHYIPIPPDMDKI